MSKIAVIIPTRNAPSVLSLTLESYWANAHQNGLVSSVTLLDNGSTAPGMDAVFAQAMRRGAHVIRHERNVGVWASINRGLVLSRSEKVFVLTSDILLAPDALAWLDAIQDDTGCAMLGPRVISDRIDDLWRLYEEPCPVTKWNTTTYNGAVWLMTRRLIEQVGFFDPRFYICYGDTDYIQRMQDAQAAYGVTEAVRCLHLDKQSRQHDHTVSQDTEVELRDWQRFAEKWQDRPDALARHPRPDRIVYELMKQRYWTHATDGQKEVSQ